MDMSASPKLKMRTRTKTKNSRKPDVITRMTQQESLAVSSLKKYFEMQNNVRNVKLNEKMGEIMCNNNMLSPPVHQQTTQRWHCSLGGPRHQPQERTLVM